MSSTADSSRARQSAHHPWLGGSNIALAIVTLVLVFVGLPSRWMPVDFGAAVIAFALSVSGVGLFLGTPWGTRMGRGVAVFLLVAGCGLATALAVTAGELAGLYGPVGAGGALILFAAALVVVPYFVLFPAFQFWFLSGPAHEGDMDKEHKLSTKVATADSTESE